ncbi:unnamed protein product [Schistocephalus solidus]|uniref:Reverse transcriptase n=1 Tax=Schistocephalus solidus TaxID=70667 RepID=A0A183T477_SCHSO|nr:unnamed protein product [Schistocephalus solidus]
MDENDVEVVENCENAEHFGRVFASVFTSEPELQLDHVNSAVVNAGPVLEFIVFPEPLVKREQKNLKEAKSSGPDDLPAKVLKELAGELSKALVHIFNLSFESGKLPSAWKTAYIYPIYKSGARSNVNNYRPVCVTSICCKIMESIIQKVTMKFLEENRLLSELQLGNLLTLQHLLYIPKIVLAIIQTKQLFKLPNLLTLPLMVTVFHNNLFHFQILFSPHIIPIILKILF